MFILEQSKSTFNTSGNTNKMMACSHNDTFLADYHVRVTKCPIRFLYLMTFFPTFCSLPPSFNPTQFSLPQVHNQLVANSNKNFNPRVFVSLASLHHMNVGKRHIAR
jgi:hypothetical protein